MKTLRANKYRGGHKVNTKIFVIFGIIFLILILPYVVFAKEERALLIPLKIDGRLNDKQKKITSNFVNQQLSTYFTVISEKDLESAKDKAIKLLKSDECTEEMCIKQMGYMLEADFTFTIEIIIDEENSLWDITIRRIDDEGSIIVKNRSCHKCNLQRAKTLISTMINGLRPGEVFAIEGKALIVINSVPTAEAFYRGNSYGNTPVRIEVDTKEVVEIELIEEGFKDLPLVFRAIPNKKIVKNVRLARLSGFLEITTDPMGASIFINDELKLELDKKPLRTPAKIRLTYGSYSIKLKLDSYQVLESEIEIRKRKTKIEYNLKANPGRVGIRIPPNYKFSAIYIDGVRVGEMDNIMVYFEVKANELHTVQLKNSKYNSIHKEFTIRPEETEKIVFEDSDFNELKNEYSTSLPMHSTSDDWFDVSNWPWWYWAVGIVVVRSLLPKSTSDGSSSDDDGDSSDPCPSGAGKCGSTRITW
jgi:hypothetical protein